MLVIFETDIIEFYSLRLIICYNIISISILIFSFVDFIDAF